MIIVILTAQTVSRTLGSGPPSKSNVKHLESDKQDKNGFLDIGRDINKLTGQEKVFYEDQRRARRFWLRDEEEREKNMDEQIEHANEDLTKVL